MMFFRVKPAIVPDFDGAASAISTSLPGCLIPGALRQVSTLPHRKP